MNVTSDEIVAVRFTPRRLSPGYDMGEIDNLLDIAAAVVSQLTALIAEGEQHLAEGTVPAPNTAVLTAPIPLFVTPPLQLTRWRESYTPDEVDQFLARLTASIGAQVERLDSLRRHFAA